MHGFKRASEIQILGASGMLRVTVKPKSGPSLLVLQAGALAVFIYFGWNRWLSFYRREPIFFIFLAVGIASSLWFQLSGSEEIEFDGQRQILAIRRRVLGWPLTREFSLDQVSALEPRYADENNNPDGLRCKVGIRTITFGKGINAEQADRILAELQSALPDAAHRLLAGTDPFGKHFTTLKLS
jgi:hypothetical protein